MGIGSYDTLSMDVSSGLPGTLVTVSNTGTGFWGTMAVTVGGVASISVTLLAHNSLSFLVPAAAVTGAVIVTNPDGESGSAGTFTVTGVTEDTLSRQSLVIGVGIFI
jgi:hypothetical protein